MNLKTHTASSMATLLLLLLINTMSSVSGYDGDAIDSTGCPAVFQSKCHCGVVSHYKYWKSDKAVFMVNCTNTGFTNTTMLEQLPTETEVLIFNGNNIPQMDWNLFGIWDTHDKLEVVDLTNNNIRGISGKTFHRVANVKRLILDHNDLIISGPEYHPRLFSNFYNLEELHLTNTFTETVDSRWYLSDLKQILIASNMTKLKKLHLEQNEIWRIEDEDMFCAIRNLSELYLGDNQLQSVDFSIECLEQLSYLNLEYNKIKRLDDKTLAKFDKVFKANPNKRNTINLIGNPFHCDCNFRNFYDWLTTTNTSLFHKNEIRCFDGYPESNQGREVIKLSRLECGPLPTDADPALANATGTTITHALLTILIMLVLGVAIMLICYHRKRLHERVKPLVVGFQKSMQYKTIDKEEVVQEVNV